PSSFASSSGWKRTFSSSRISPGPSCRAAFSTSGPTQSDASGTGRPSSDSSRSATGFSEYCGFGLPFGRPRCEASTTDAPAPSASWIVGSTAVRRVSSDTAPCSSGTLRSARRKTRLPARLSRSIESFVKLERLGDEPDQVPHAAGVPPLVVVPRQDLHHVAVDQRRGRQVDDRRVRVAVEIDGDELLV